MIYCFDCFFFVFYTNFRYVYNQLISIKMSTNTQMAMYHTRNINHTIKINSQRQISQWKIFRNSPAVSFWLTTSGNTDSGLGEECSGLWHWELLPGLSLCVGLPQNGVQRLLFAGRMPSIGSKSKDLFRVAHAIFSLYLRLF